MHTTEEFKKELATLLNKHSVDAAAHTPDYILANYLTQCIQNFSAAHYATNQWFGFGRKGS